MSGGCSERDRDFVFFRRQTLLSLSICTTRYTLHLRRHDQPHPCHLSHTTQKAMRSQ